MKSIGRRVLLTHLRAFQWAALSHGQSSVTSSVHITRLSHKRFSCILQCTLCVKSFLKETLTWSYLQSCRDHPVILLRFLLLKHGAMEIITSKLSWVRENNITSQRGLLRPRRPPEHLVDFAPSVCGRCNKLSVFTSIQRTFLREAVREKICLFWKIKHEHC